MGATSKIELPPAEETYRIPGLPEEHQPGALEKPLANAAPVLPMAPAETRAVDSRTYSRESGADRHRVQALSPEKVAPSVEMPVAAGPTDAFLALQNAARPTRIDIPERTTFAPQLYGNVKQIAEHLQNIAAAGPSAIGALVAGFGTGWQVEAAKTAALVTMIRNTDTYHNALARSTLMLLAQDSAFHLVENLRKFRFFPENASPTQEMEIASQFITDAMGLQQTFETERVDLAVIEKKLLAHQLEMIRMTAETGGALALAPLKGAMVEAVSIGPAMLKELLVGTAQAIKEGGKEFAEVPSMIVTSFVFGWFKAMAISAGEALDEAKARDVVAPVAIGTLPFIAANVYGAAAGFIFDGALKAAPLAEKIAHIATLDVMALLVSMPIAATVFMYEHRHKDWKVSKSDGAKAQNSAGKADAQSNETTEGEFREVKE